MGHVLSLTDGSFTAIFNNIAYMLSEYTPQSPQARYATQEGLQDGGEVGAVYYQNVTETIEGAVVGSTTALVQTNLEILEKILDNARLRQRSKTGERTYIHYQVDGDAYTYRSEILSGRLEIVKGGMAIWGNKHTPIRLHFTRRYFWELLGLTEVQLASKASATPATGGKSIHNHNDASQGNYVQIASSQITGVLPTPAKIVLVNNTGSAQGYRNFYLAVNANSDPANMAHFLEGEDCDGPVDQSSPVSSASTNSDTGYGSLAISPSPAYFQWTLPSSLLQDTQGRWFRLLARFHAYSGTSTKIRASIMDDSGNISLYDGDEVTLPSSVTELVDLGTLPFPPGGYDPLAAAHVLQLACKTASSGVVNLDYVQLTPVESYRHIVMRGNQIASNDAVVDDGTEEQTYSNESNVHHYILSPRGSPLLLFPGKTQRIYILHDEGAGSDVNNTTSVSVFYRPRRLTI